jgi:nucleoid-associated protein YgaU
MIPISKMKTIKKEISLETLEKLALKYYGSPEKWRLLYAANNDQLSLGRPLKVGMVLKVPPR